MSAAPKLRPETREDLQRLADEQAALRRVATLTAQGACPADIFSAVSDELGRLFASEQTAVGRFEDDGSAVVVVGVSAGIHGVSIGTRWPLVDFLASTAVYRTGRTARNERAGWKNTSGPVADSLREIGCISTVAAPIIVEGKLWGVMTVSDTRQRLPPETEDRVENFTELVATAISNAECRSELAASRRRIVTASDDARRRIERDLHDGTQQRLLSLALAVRTAEADLPSDRRDLRSRLSGIATGLTQAVEEIQELSRGIHPATLSQGGLAPALKELARRSPIPVQVNLRTRARLSEAIELAAYFVASEALANAAKHADASRIDLSLATHNGSLLLTIRDDGVGGAEVHRGSGLIGLTDRADTLGGSIRVESLPGNGTQIIAELPLGLEPEGMADLAHLAFKNCTSSRFHANA